MRLGARTRQALELEDYEERRRRWRRSGFWRGVGFVLLLLAGLGALGAWLEGRPRFGPHIAEVPIVGLIEHDPALLEVLDRVEERDQVKAVILFIDSPGGTTAGSEALHTRIRAIAEKKPVVAVMGEVAASGGYIAALAADHIVARGNTLTGSIGVILEYPRITELLDRWGVDVETVRSSELKGGPAPWREPTEAERALERALVADAYAWFRGLVAERRGLEGAALEAVSDGRVLTGRMALEAGLIDAIGGREEALEWLGERDSQLSQLPVDSYEPEREAPGVLAPLGSFLGKTLGLREISRALGPRLYSLAR